VQGFLRPPRVKSQKKEKEGSALKQEAFLQWIEQIYATKEDEFDCEQMQDLLPQFVEAELNQTVPPPFAKKFHENLKQCPDCQEIYDGLRYVVEMEQAGEITPQTQTTPLEAIPAD